MATNHADRSGPLAPPARNEILTNIRIHVAKKTQREMAEMIGTSVRTYQSWELGEVTNPTEQLLAPLYALTGCKHREELGFPSASARPLPPIPLHRVLSTERLGEAASAALRGQIPTEVIALIGEPAPPPQRWITDAEIDRLQGQTAILAQAYEVLGGAALSPDAITGILRASAGLLRGQYSRPNAHRAMRLAVAEFALVGGTILVDQHDYPTAQVVYLLALATAPSNGGSDPQQRTVRLRALAAIAQQAVYDRDANTANAMLDLADGLTQATPPPGDVDALLTALRAITAAIDDEVDLARYLVREATNRYTAVRNPIIHPSTVYHLIAFALSTSELCHGRPLDLATDAYAAAITACAPEQHRSRTFNRAMQMMTLLQRGDYDESLRAANSVLAEKRWLHSELVNEAISLIHLVPRAVRGDPETAPILELLRDYPPPVLASVPESDAISTELRKDRAIANGLAH